MAPEQDVTALLGAWGQGDREADSRLMALVYDDRRRMRWQLARSPATIKRDRTRARAWLFRELRPLIVVRDPSTGGP